MRAKEIAARVVNKRRREEGRTDNKRTMGTGNPNAPLPERTRDELVALLRLDTLLDQPVRQLSLGQRMRAEIAASLPKSRR